MATPDEPHTITNDMIAAGVETWENCSSDFMEPQDIVSLIYESMANLKRECSVGPPLYTEDGHIYRAAVASAEAFEDYEPMGVGGGASGVGSYFDEATGTFHSVVGSGQQTAPLEAPWLKRPPSYLRRQSDARVAALEAEVKRLSALLADAENKATSYTVKVATVADIWANALRGGDGTPR